MADWVVVVLLPGLGVLLPRHVLHRRQQAAWLLLSARFAAAARLRGFSQCRTNATMPFTSYRLDCV